MTTQEKIKLVNDLVAHYSALTKVFTDLSALTGSQPEARLNTVVWDSFDGYTKAVSNAIGDHFEYVSWYIWENSCGKRGFEVSWNGGKSKVCVNGVKALLKVIEHND